MKASERQKQAEKELLEQLKANPDDNALWERVVAEKRTHLAKMAAGYTESEAEGQELVQEALISARKEIRRINTTLQGWLYRAVQRAALKRVQRNREDAEDLAGPQGHDAERKVHVDWSEDDPHPQEDPAHLEKKPGLDEEVDEVGPANETERLADQWYELFTFHYEVLDLVERRVARLAWERDLPRREIAEQTGLTVTEVKAVLLRTQRKLEKAAGIAA